MKSFQSDEGHINQAAGSYRSGLGPCLGRSVKAVSLSCAEARFLRRGAATAHF
jgi:hypothetical protein